MLGVIEDNYSVIEGVFQEVSDYDYNDNDDDNDDDDEWNENDDTTTMIMMTVMTMMSMTSTDVRRGTSGTSRSMKNLYS